MTILKIIKKIVNTILLVIVISVCLNTIKEFLFYLENSKKVKPHTTLSPKQPPISTLKILSEKDIL